MTAKENQTLNMLREAIKIISMGDLRLIHNIVRMDMSRGLHSLSFLDKYTELISEVVTARMMKGTDVATNFLDKMLENTNGHFRTGNA